MPLLYLLVVMLISLFVFNSKEDLTQGVALVRKAVYPLSHFSSFLFSVSFKGKVSSFCLGLASDLNPSMSSSQVAGIEDMYHPIHLSGQDLANILPGLA